MLADLNRIVPPMITGQDQALASSLLCCVLVVLCHIPCSFSLRQLKCSMTEYELQQKAARKLYWWQWNVCNYKQFS